MFQIGMSKFKLLRKLERFRRGHMLLMIVKAKKLLKLFTEKDCKK